MSHNHSFTDALQSYLASAVGFAQDVNWMAVGATGSLMLARKLRASNQNGQQIGMIAWPR